MKKSERQYLHKAMARVPKGAIVVELGSYLGKSSCALAKGIKKYRRKAKLFCVDNFKCPFKESQELRHSELVMKQIFESINVQERFEKVMCKYPHTTIVEDSAQASSQFQCNSVDFLFVDADHTYEGVMRDIVAWLPKMKPHSIMCGHDYGGHYSGVERAVRETFGDKVHLPAHSIWEVLL